MTPASQTRSAPSAAFTRIELVAVLGALALLAAIALPALAKSREPGRRISCVNNLRILAQAALMHSAENDGLFPARGVPTRWPARLQRYYGDTNLLRCPSDAPNPGSFGGSPTNAADPAPRSYIMNGFADYFYATSPGVPLLPGQAMPEAAISHPTATVLFGEKDTDSGHFHTDLLQGDDFTEVEHGRHTRAAGDPRAGGSNHAFADGSVRFLSYGSALFPINLWAVTDPWRLEPSNPR